MTISLGFVVAEFNRDLTYQMELLGREHAEFLGQQLKRPFLFQESLICPLQ
jgi:6,7-dimethyl-8-ribityllumazine synthase